MSRIAIAAAIGAVILGWPFSSQAQQTTAAPPDAKMSAPPDARSSAPTAEDLAAFSNARLASLKVGLGIKPEQEANWATFETTLRALAKQRQDRSDQMRKEFAAMRGTAPDPIDILRRRADAMSTSAGDIKRLADAAEPLYKSLDDGQKRRMLVLVAGIVPRR